MEKSFDTPTRISADYADYADLEITQAGRQQKAGTEGSRQKAAVALCFLPIAFCLLLSVLFLGNKVTISCFLEQVFWQVNKPIHEITRTEKQLTRKLLDLFRVISWIMS